MSFLYFPDKKPTDGGHFYIFPHINYEPTDEEFTNAFDCFFSNFEYPQKFKAQILYGFKSFQKIGQMFVTTDFKDISKNLLQLLKKHFEEDLSTIPHFRGLNEASIYIRIFNSEQILPEFPFIHELVTPKSTAPIRNLYRFLLYSWNPKSLMYIQLDNYITDKLTEFRHDCVPDTDTHLEFKLLDMSERPMRN